MTIPGVLEPSSTGSSLFGGRKLKGSSSERPKVRKNRVLKGPKGDEAFKECPCWEDTSLADLNPCDVTSVWIGASILGIGFEKDTPYFELAWATSVFSDYGSSATLDEQDGLERFKGNLGVDSGRSRRALSHEASAGRQDERNLQGLYDYGDRVYSTWVPTGQCGYFPGFNEWYKAFTEETNEKKAGLKSRECSKYFYTAGTDTNLLAATKNSCFATNSLISQRGILAMLSINGLMTMGLTVIFTFHGVLVFRILPSPMDTLAQFLTKGVQILSFHVDASLVVANERGQGLCCVCLSTPVGIGFLIIL